MFHFHRMVNANTRKNIPNKRMSEKITSTANLLYQIYTHTHARARARTPSTRARTPRTRARTHAHTRTHARTRAHTHAHRRLRNLTVCQPVSVYTSNNKTMSLYTARVLVGKPEGKRPLGRPRRKWEDNIMMDLQEVGYKGMDWIDVAQDRDRWRALVNAVMILRVP